MAVPPSATTKHWLLFAKVTQLAFVVLLIITAD